jgi:hypothetical protein
MSLSIVFVRAVIGRSILELLFSEPLVLLSFCLFLKEEGFHLYFLQFRKTFSFANKTEAFLNHQSFQTASGFLSDAFQG